MNQENKEKLTNQTPTKQMVDDFEITIGEKNKKIAKLEKEVADVARNRAQMETKLDEEKDAKQAALDRAERAEARYLRNNELKNRSEQQEKDLLSKLFD